MARRVRALVIDDTASWLSTGLGSRHLDVVPVLYKEQPLRALTGWSQHLWLWRNNRFPSDEPDIVLVDCKFEADTSAPSLTPLSAQGQPPTARPDTDGQDGRGLLHGAIYLARLFGRKGAHPFGFSIYSQQAPALQNDPYARTFVGFILAMTDSAREIGTHGIFDLEGSLEPSPSSQWTNVCKDWLANSAKQTPATAWGPALEMYRSQLKAAFAKGAYLVRTESWDSAVQALKESSLQEDLSLAWHRNDGSTDEVQLISLFADTLLNDEWSNTTGERALKWLLEITVPEINFVDTTVNWLNQLFIIRNGNISIRDSTPDLPRGYMVNPHRPEVAQASYTNFAHACAAVAQWLLDRRVGLTTSSGRLVDLIGLSARQADRYFVNVAQMSWGGIVDHLDNAVKGARGTWKWPFAHLWQLEVVVRTWWSKNFEKEGFPFR